MRVPLNRDYGSLTPYYCWANLSSALSVCSRVRSRHAACSTCCAQASSLGSMVTSVKIRRAVAADFAGVLRLLAQLSPTWNEEDVDEPVTAHVERTWARMLGQEGRAVLVAEDAGRIVATLDMVVVAVLTDGAAPTAVIMNMVVDRLYRRAGIGRALLEVAVSLARNA